MKDGIVMLTPRFPRMALDYATRLTQVLIVSKIATGQRDESPTARRASSRCRTENAKSQRLLTFQVAATATRHVFIAAVRRVRCVWAEARWRWSLKML
jgi:hypothetical protein